MGFRISYDAGEGTATLPKRLMEEDALFRADVIGDFIGDLSEHYIDAVNGFMDEMAAHGMKGRGEDEPYVTVVSFTDTDAAGRTEGQMSVSFAIPIKLAACLLDHVKGLSERALAKDLNGMVAAGLPPFDASSDAGTRLADFYAGYAEDRVNATR